jgi:curved DNA-binding protein
LIRAYTNLDGLSAPEVDYYAALGVERAATTVEIRDAYRQLAKRHHPDRNRDAEEARVRTQALNAAYEVLRDPARRRAYDQELGDASRAAAPGRGSKIERNITQEVRLRVEDFIRGTSIEVQVRDPANPIGAETYRLDVPPGTAPGARFRLPRKAPMERGFVQLRLKVLPGYRFKARGSDLLCELRIDARRALQGGSETMEKPTGGFLHVQIPAGAKRGEIVRIPGEGMPTGRGGRGDLLVRITYRLEVRVARSR